MVRLLPLVILIVDIVVIIDILKGNKDLERKILWIIAVVFLPFLGPVLYYLIGQKQ